MTTTSEQIRANTITAGVVLADTGETVTAVRDTRSKAHLTTDAKRTIAVPATAMVSVWTFTYTIKATTSTGDTETQVVTAPTEGKARSAFMAHTKLRLSGEGVEYAVRQH